MVACEKKDKPLCHPDIPEGATSCDDCEFNMSREIHAIGSGVGSNSSPGGLIGEARYCERGFWQESY